VRHFRARHKLLIKSNGSTHRDSTGPSSTSLCTTPWSTRERCRRRPRRNRHRRCHRRGHQFRPRSTGECGDARTQGTQGHTAIRSSRVIMTFNALIPPSSSNLPPTPARRLSCPTGRSEATNQWQWSPCTETSDPAPRRSDRPRPCQSHRLLCLQSTGTCTQLLTRLLTQSCSAHVCCLSSSLTRRDDTSHHADSFSLTSP
jgi:hypothetical protein